MIAEAHELGLAGAARHRPQPPLGPAPLVPGGAGRRAGLARARVGSSSATDAGRRATSPRTTGRATSAGPPGPASPTADGRPRPVVPAPVHARAARPRLDQSRGRGRVRRRRCVSGSSSGSTASGSTSPTAWPRPRVCPTSARPCWPAGGRPEVVDHPHWDRDEVHEIYRSWRALADTYEDPRVFVAEAWVHDPERLAQYVRADELHTAFNFDFLLAPWEAEPMRESIIDLHSRRTTRSARRRPGCCPTTTPSERCRATPVPQARPADCASWTTSSTCRPTSRSGCRRARAAALLMLALPGGAYVYQGEELGLPEVEDLPEEALRIRAGSSPATTERGRDGCRVPIPWSGSEPPFGFSPPDADAAPWLPQPPAWRELTRRGAGPATTARCSSSTAGRCAPPRAARARRRRAQLAAGAGRRARVRPRPGIRLHRQYVGRRAGAASARRGGVARERRVI